MTRKKLYLLTLIFPFFIFSIWLFFGFYLRGLEYGIFFINEIKRNWFHIFPGLIGIIGGIEYFKSKLVITSSISYKASFLFILKIFILEAVINTLTNLIFTSSKNITDSFIFLIFMSFIFYLILALITSSIIGGIIYKYGNTKN